MDPQDFQAPLFPWSRRRLAWNHRTVTQSRLPGRCYHASHYRPTARPRRGKSI